MSLFITLARPYAKACFRYAESNNALTDWSLMLRRLAFCCQNKKVNAVLSDRSLSAKTKLDLLLSVCESLLSHAGQRFLSLLSDNKRLVLLPEIARLFDKLKAQHDDITEVTVTSAFVLTDTQKERLSSALAHHFSGHIHLSCQVDSALLGGAIIRSADKVIDGSVRRRISKLATAVMN